MTTAQLKKLLIELAAFNSDDGELTKALRDFAELFDVEDQPNLDTFLAQIRRVRGLNAA